MIYSLKGTVLLTSRSFAVVEVGGAGFKVFTAERTAKSLQEGEQAFVLCHLHVREDALDLYGFTRKEELEFFELLLGISGVGPKSALAILDVAELAELGAAIQENRPDLLTRASGIGRKTAERIILELKGKVHVGAAEEVVRQMEGDSDLVETLVNLGYRKDQAKAAVGHVAKEVTGLEARLREALKVLGKR